MLEIEDIKRKACTLRGGENLYSVSWREWLVVAKYNTSQDRREVASQAKELQGAS